jgi:type I restriction enzyme S subunit
MKTKAVIENGFKETEIGLIPEDWETTTLENEKLFEFANGLWKGKKVPFVTAKVIRNTNFNNDGTLSLDDVAELDVEEKQFIKRQLSGGDIILERSGGGPKQPVGRVVFFDLKEVNYSFSNFTTRIRVKDINKIQPKYILYYLLHFYNRGCTYELQQRTTGIRNLNFKDYKKIQVPLPSLTEQRKIAFVLLKIQQTIEQQHKIIETARELKKSLMNKLFTEGLHGEEQKETGIGLMPKSWRIVELEDICRPKKEIVIPEGKGKYIYVGLEHMETGEIWLKNHGYDNEVRSAKFKFNESDVLYGKLRPYLDKAALPNLSGICSTDIIVLTPNSKITQHLLIYIIHLNNFIEYAKATTSGTNHPRTSWNSLKRYKLTLPSIKEQKEIANILLNVEKKLSQAESKKQTLQALFKTMLNQLMTGKVRVKDFDFEVN